MKNTGNIEHEGIVTDVHNDVATIAFTRSSGCSGCGIQASCGMAESAEKRVRIQDNEKAFFKGEHVVVCISKGGGLKAVFIGYFIPFLFVLVTLLTLINAGLAEPLAGLLSLVSLIPGYILIKILARYFKSDLLLDVRKQ